jgi:hypothetical protein
VKEEINHERHEKNNSAFLSCFSYYCSSEFFASCEEFVDGIREKLAGEAFNPESLITKARKKENTKKA